MDVLASVRHFELRRCKLRESFFWRYGNEKILDRSSSFDCLPRSPCVYFTSREDQRARRLCRSSHGERFCRSLSLQWRSRDHWTRRIDGLERHCGPLECNGFDRCARDSNCQLRGESCERSSRASLSADPRSIRESRSESCDAASD